MSAFVGAGVVALGAHQLPDAKAVNPTVLANLENASAASSSIADRDNAAAPASRGEDRSAAKTDTTTEANPNDVWLLPLDNYEFTAPFGVRFGKLHAGIDLAAAEGTPFKSIHSGVVTAAGYNGGYGNAITVKNPDGTETVYAHARRLLVKTGDTVKAGQVIGEVGMTGYSYGSHLHLEIHVGGTPCDPIPFLRAHGVDIKLGVESSLAISADAAS